MPAGMNAPKDWPPPPLRLHGVRVLRQAAAVQAGDFAAEDGTEGTVGTRNADSSTVCGFGFLQVELLEAARAHRASSRCWKSKTLRSGRGISLTRCADDAATCRCWPARLVTCFSRTRKRSPRPTSSSHAAHAQPGHDLAQLLGHEQHEVHHVFRLARETPAQLGVLRRDAHRAGVQVAHAHHHAAHGTPAARSRSRIPPRPACRRWPHRARS